MRVTYVHYAKVPSREANSVHIMKMSQAFQQEGHDTTLIVPQSEESLQMDTGALWDHYGISTPFDLHRIEVSSSRGASGRDHSFALKALRTAARLQSDLVFTRHVYTAMYASLRGLPTIHEAHGPLITGRLGWLYLAALFRGSGFRRLVVITEAGRRSFVGDRLPANQVIVAGTIQAVAEGLVLGAKAGVDPELIVQAVGCGLARCGILEVRAPRMLSGIFEPGFMVKLHLKDLGLALSAGKSLEVPLPTTAYVNEMFKTLVAQGKGDQDHSSLLQIVEGMAGIEVRKKSSN